MTIGPGRLLAAFAAAELGPTIRVEVLAVNHVVRDDEAIDAGAVRGLCPFEQKAPRALILGGEIDEGRGQLWG